MSPFSCKIVYNMLITNYFASDPTLRGPQEDQLGHAGRPLHLPCRLRPFSCRVARYV